MVPQLFQASCEAFQAWSNTMTKVLFLPWTIYLHEWDLGHRQLANATNLTHWDKDQLEQYARERARQGFAPPNEIYQSPIREQIDWLQFPSWARPADPDSFGNSPHEG